MNNKMKTNEAQNDSDLRVTDFVNSLLLETQQEMVRWDFEDGPGSVVSCICEGQKLLLTPELITTETKRFSFSYINAVSGKSCVLMQAQTTPDYPSELRNLYEAVSEQINERPDEVNCFMKIFIKRSNERQALYSILDALRLAEATLSTLLRDT